MGIESERDPTLIYAVALRDLEYSLEGKSFREGIDWLVLQNQILTVDESWIDLKFKINYNYENTDLRIVGYRRETSKEETQRLEREKKDHLKKEKDNKNEFALYLKLKEKYEKGSIAETKSNVGSEPWVSGEFPLQ